MWTPDPEVLSVLRDNKIVKADFFLRLFGPDGAGDLRTYPYSLAAKLSCRDEDGDPIPGGIGITQDDLLRFGSLGCDLDLGENGSGDPHELTEESAKGIWTGVADVTAFGAKPDGVTDCRQAINDAIAYASDGPGIVWFPRTEDGSVYLHSGGTTGYFPIVPNLTYRAAQGVVLRSNGQGAQVATFGYMGSTSAFVNSLTVFENIIVDRPNGLAWRFTPSSGQARGRITFTNCSVAGTDPAYYYMWLRQLYYLNVIACRFTGSPSMFFLTDVGGLIYGNTFNSGAIGSTAHTYCSEIYWDAEDAELLSTPHIIGNRFIGDTPNGASIRFYPIYTDIPATIVGNTLETVCTTVGKVPAFIYASGDHSVVVNNRIVPNMTEYTDSTSVGILMEGSASTVNNNRIGTVDSPEHPMGKGISTRIGIGRNAVVGNIIGPGVTMPLDIVQRSPWTEGDAQDIMGDHLRYPYLRNCIAVAKCSDLVAGRSTFHPVGSGFNEWVRSVWYEERDPFPQTMVAVGDFTFAGSRTVSYVAKHQLGGQWEACGTFNGRVRDVRYHSGYWYVAGDFTQVNGVAIKRIARSSDLVSWEAVGGGVQGASPSSACWVNRIMLHQNDLWFAGNFTTSWPITGGSSFPVPGVVKLAVLSNTFAAPPTGGPSGVVEVLDLGSDGTTLMVVGDFESFYVGAHLATDIPTAVNPRWSMCGVRGDAWVPLAAVSFPETGAGEHARIYRVLPHNNGFIIGGYFPAGLAWYNGATTVAVPHPTGAIYFGPDETTALTHWDASLGVDVTDGNAGTFSGPLPHTSVNALAGGHGEFGTSVDGDQRVLIGSGNTITLMGRTVDGRFDGIGPIFGVPTTKAAGVSRVPYIWHSIVVGDKVVVVGRFHEGTGYGVSPYRDDNTFGRPMNLITTVESGR